MRQAIDFLWRTLYYCYTMNKISDKHLIEKYITHCKALGLTADMAAALVRRSHAWGSLLMHRELGNLQFQTRSRMERVLSSAEANASIGGQI